MLSACQYTWLHAQRKTPQDSSSRHEVFLGLRANSIATSFHERRGKSCWKIRALSASLRDGHAQWAVALWIQHAKFDFIEENVCGWNSILLEWKWRKLAGMKNL